MGTSIIESLDRWGLKEGIFKHSIDKKYYLDRLLIEYNNGMAEMEIKGSKLIVELVKQLPPKLEENTPCDIIASKDGIIEIIILRGEALLNRVNLE